MNEVSLKVGQSNRWDSNFIGVKMAVYPEALAARHPYILEKLESLWSKPTEMRAYFQELLVTQRENRQGFPLDIYMEIFALSERYNKLHPLPDNPDDDFWTWAKPGS